MAYLSAIERKRQLASGLASILLSQGFGEPIISSLTGTPYISGKRKGDPKRNQQRRNKRQHMRRNRR